MSEEKKEKIEKLIDLLKKEVLKAKKHLSPDQLQRIREKIISTGKKIPSKEEEWSWNEWLFQKGVKEH